MTCSFLRSTWLQEATSEALILREPGGAARRVYFSGGFSVLCFRSGVLGERTSSLVAGDKDGLDWLCAPLAWAKVPAGKLPCNVSFIQAGTQWQHICKDEYKSSV